MIGTFRRFLRSALPEPVRMSVALARRQLREFGPRRRFAARPDGAPSGAAGHPVATVTQPIKRTAFWEGKYHNISRGAELLDGVRIAPGETLSFWRLVGRPSEAAGFQMGRGIRGDALGGDIGGGLCQVSGIVYEAGLRAGLEVVERFPHSQDLYAEEDRFAPLGLDATVVWPYKDLQIRNGHDAPVTLRVAVEGEEIIAAVHGPAALAAHDLAIERIDGMAERHVTVTRIAPDGGRAVVSANRYALPPAEPAPPPCPIGEALRTDGFAFAGLADLADAYDPAGWAAFAQSWDRMPRDEYMADGGTYRRRRFSTFALEDGAIRAKPPQPHYQTTGYNPLNGGIDRHYEPIEPAIAAHPLFEGLMRRCGALFAAARPPEGGAWHVEAHQFRIEAAPDGEGRPTPEGMHRDGVDWVLILLVAREGVEGGVTTIAAPGGEPLVQRLLETPGAACLIDDRAVRHEVSPIRAAGTAMGYRDALVLTFRAEGAAD
ncbi:2OG-Fe dioxygenase family protein [Sphingomonas canadensis]|uniref:2OG-Fe dioxygenase family protein n=1 Tax=Sphingomonas canadensis TaxID=1219257 RepID=A0ABW3H5Y7_9SPHN|nr:2OG-Fe dioxygenase family protein [Sphingomonas canadensis]MCW3836505.1 2OG-Fe dioxygenase family protein [Sphingomonas canadensis]